MRRKEKRKTKDYEEKDKGVRNTRAPWNSTYYREVGSTKKGVVA